MARRPSGGLDPLSFVGWPWDAERVCVCTDNFKPESIDLYKPGTIEVKREGDRKTATIERASTAVSPSHPPHPFPARLAVATSASSVAHLLTILPTARRGSDIYWRRKCGQGCGLCADI